MDDTVWQDATLAETYLTGVRQAVPLADEQFDVMARLIAMDGRPLRRFLDLGCGDGALAAFLLDRCPASRGVLMDFSPPMLDAARAARAGYGKRVEIIEGDYGDPAWVTLVAHAGPFDAVVSGYSIHHQEDERKWAIYQEIYELLAPGGWFVNIEHVASATPELQRIFDERFIDALCAYEDAHGQGRSREEVTATYYERDDKGANKLTLVETQCVWLREIGFEQVDCYCKLWELGVFGGRRPA